jgi:hypothetical protein
MKSSKQIIEIITGIEKAKEPSARIELKTIGLLPLDHNLIFIVS